MSRDLSKILQKIATSIIDDSNATPEEITARLMGGALGMFTTAGYASSGMAPVLGSIYAPMFYTLPTFVGGAGAWAGYKAGERIFKDTTPEGTRISYTQQGPKYTFPAPPNNEVLKANMARRKRINTTQNNNPANLFADKR